MNSAEMFSLAWKHHQAGELFQAEQLYRQILVADCSCADAWCFLGAACDAQGKFAEAQASYLRAIQLKPDYAAAHYNLALALEHEGKLEEALASYQRALRLQPDNLAARTNLGNVRKARGELDEAIACYRQVLRLQPDFAEVLVNLGNALAAQDKLEEAAVFWRQALRHRPDLHEVYAYLGNALVQQDKLDEAVACYYQALRVDAGFADAHNGLGYALERQNKLDEAIRCYRRALALKPNFAGAYNNLGNALLRQRKLNEAGASYREALRLNPNLAAAHNGLGHVLRLKNQLDEAVHCFQRALQLKPDFAEAYNSLGCTFFDAAHHGLRRDLRRQERLDEAVRCFQAALRLKPDFAEAYCNLGSASLWQGQVDLALANFRQALRLQPDLALAQSNLASCLNYDAEADPDLVFREHCRWGQTMCDVRRAMCDVKTGTSDIAHRTSHIAHPDPERRLRIGYVSPDFCQHPIQRYFEPVLANHDSRQVEVFCYAEVAVPDAVTNRLQNLAHAWRWTVGLTDEQVAEQVRSDRIDILVDLAGHTTGNRLGVFARKPAPVQATWLGYLNTTGLTTVDYRLTDDVLDPPGQTVRDTEEVVRLPGGMCCFAPPPADVLPCTPLPALCRGHITFGSLHGRVKLNARVFELWSLVLKALPTARLLMFHDTLVATAQEEIRQQFTQRGVASDRLDLRHGSSAGAYLAVYREIDISLDTHPYSGGVTTCESLWMGVPVLSLCGARPVARNSAALLSRVGLADWAVENAENYVAKARRWANDLDELAQLRAGLRDRVVRCLCDGRRFTGMLEEAYRTMWRHWCSQERQEIPNPKPQTPNKSK